MAQTPEQAMNSVMVKRATEQYKQNRHLILQAQEELVEETGKMPTMKAIADRTGLTTQTVYKHFREMKIKDDLLPIWNKYAMEILNRHLALARQDKNLKVALEAVKLIEEKWFDLFDSRKVEHETTNTKKLAIEVVDKRNVKEIPADAEFTEIKEEDATDTTST